MYPMHCEYSISETNYRLKKDPLGLIREAERDFRDQIDETVYRFGDGRILCIAGPSASGKTTTSNKIAEGIRASGREAIVLSMDDFYKSDAELEPVDGKLNYEVIDALRIDLMGEKLNQLLKTGFALMPRFDFSEDRRIDDAQPVLLSPSGAIIIEGIHGLNNAVKECFPDEKVMRVYVSPHSGFRDEEGLGIDKRQVRLIRRMIRDQHHRGCPVVKTLELWEEVCRAEDLYVRPMSRFADYRINTVHLYEPALFRDEAIGLFDQVPVDSKYYQMVQYIRCSLEKFDRIPQDMLPKDSLLREFTKN